MDACRQNNYVVQKKSSLKEFCYVCCSWSCSRFCGGRAMAVAFLLRTLVVQRAIAAAEVLTSIPPAAGAREEGSVLGLPVEL